MRLIRTKPDFARQSGAFKRHHDQPTATMADSGFDITGIVHTIHDPATRGNYTSRKVWIETTDNPQYPQVVEVDLGGDKCGLIERYDITVGQKVTVSLNLRGRVWTPADGSPAKVFNTLAAWKFVVLEQAAPVHGDHPLTPDPVAQSMEDLPF